MSEARLVEDNHTRAGIRLCAGYAFKPNELGYCGPEGVHRKILEFSTGKNNNSGEIRGILENFEGLFPYLKLISENTGRVPFDYEVVEAYWLGNKLLEQVPTSAYRQLIAKEFSRYIHNAGEISKKIPEGCLPCHNCHTLFLFPMVAKIPQTDKNIRNCMIRCGKISEELNTSLIRNPKKGEKVSIHWNWAIHRLTPLQERNLNHYTEYHLRLLNRESKNRKDGFKK